MWNVKRPNRFIGVLLVIGLLGSTLRDMLSDSYISTRNAWLFHFIPLGVQRSSLSEGNGFDGCGKSWGAHVWFTAPMAELWYAHRESLACVPSCLIVQRTMLGMAVAVQDASAGCEQ